MFWPIWLTMLSVTKYHLLHAFKKNQCCSNDACDVPVHDLVPFCEDEGRFFKLEETIRKDCNTCVCTTGGFACTIMACEPRCEGDLVWNTCASACPSHCDQSEETFCIAVCVEACDCPRGQVRLSENSTTCVDPQECSSTLQNNTACRQNSDCPSKQWCRTIDESYSAFHCVPYAKEGEHCNGYTMPQNYESCAPGFSCESRGSPLLVDAPGICTSRTRNCRVEMNNMTHQNSYWPYSGSLFRNYSYGESFEGIGDNWCNRCICMESGMIACTEMGCPPCADQDIVRCLVDPCQNSSCEAFPNAICKANMCFSCTAEYFVDGNKVDCRG